MIVLDASAAVEFLLWTDRGQRVAAQLQAATTVHVPELLAVEVTQVVRRLVAAGTIDPSTGAQLVADVVALDAHRYGHDPLLPRVFELRDNLTAYDATYVALAEALGAGLVSYDERIATAAGHQVPVVAP